MNRKLRILALGLACLLVLSILFRTIILAALGSYLVHSGPPQKADIAVVLGGDSYGNRILTAARLVREGYAPKVLVSGPNGFYGHHECDLAIPFAVKAGYPESYFIHFENEATSTFDEARAIVPELRRLDAKRILLVTSNYHTRRAGGIYRAAAPDMTFFVVAAPDIYFKAESWWHNREGRKVFAVEWMKTVAEWTGV